MGYIVTMQTIVELETFTRQAEGLFTKAEVTALIELVAGNPTIGEVITGTGGIRKLRFGARGKGKRGGSRVIYFVYNEDNPIYLIARYSKGVQENITPGQKKVMAAFAAAIKAVARKGK